MEETVKSTPGVERDLRLILPQDNSGLEFRDDLPTLLGGELPQMSLPTKKLQSPIISVFEDVNKVIY